MYKYKIKKSVARRFRVTRTGKVIYRAQGGRHLRRKKTKSQIRGYGTPHVLTGKFARRIKRLLGLA